MVSGRFLMLQNSCTLQTSLSEPSYWECTVFRCYSLPFELNCESTVFVVCVSGDNYMSPGILAQLWVEEEKKRKELERKLRETLQANQVWNYDTVFSPLW